MRNFVKVFGFRRWEQDTLLFSVEMEMQDIGAVYGLVHKNLRMFPA